MSQQLLSAQDTYLESATPLMRAGAYAQDLVGRWWVYLQAAETLSKGHVLMPVGDGPVIDADVDSAAAVDTRRVYGNGDFTTVASDDNLVDGDFLTQNGHQYFLWINSGAAQGQGGPITRWHDVSSVDAYWIQSDDGQIDEALTTDSDYVVRVWSRVTLTAAAYRKAVVAVAQMAVTDEYWFWGLVRGPGVVDIDTSDSTIEFDRELIPSATTAGEAEGLNAHTVTSTTALTAADLLEQVSVFANAYGGDVTADGHALAMMKCPIWGNIPVPNNLTKGYPDMSLLRG